MGRLIKKRGKTTLSGPAGNVDFYSFGGTTYFKSRAKKHKKSKSKSAVAGRSNFASVVNFAKEIIKVPQLKEIWSHSSLKGRNEFQKLIRYNMLLAHDGNLTFKNFFTPRGHNLYIPDLSLEEDTLSFTFDVYKMIKPPLRLHMFFYLYNCKMKNSFDFLIMPKFIDINKDDTKTFRKLGDRKYTINRKFPKDEIEFLSYFKDVVVLLAVTGSPTIPNRKSWSNTVGFDIPLV